MKTQAAKAQIPWKAYITYPGKTKKDLEKEYLFLSAFTAGHILSMKSSALQRWLSLQAHKLLNPAQQHQLDSVFPGIAHKLITHIPQLNTWGFFAHAVLLQLYLDLKWLMCKQHVIWLPSWPSLRRSQYTASQITYVDKCILLNCYLWNTFSLESQDNSQPKQWD